MKRIFLALALALACFSTARADTCTDGVAVTTASTQIVPASDVVGGRHFLFLQNIGAEAVYCAIGATATTSNGVLLQTGGSFLLEQTQGPSGSFKPVPSGAVNCITGASSTTVLVCDY